ncbi:site-specific DNA-methyltransferase [Bacillus pumilus]|uniref:DNA-methyltransferase n=1 Tax=Bacillus pumilus TaxID=1408 RepID=UPI00017A5F5E|nr:DNA methylase [Bacillus pumilus ATCC 7061]MDR4269010.1 site-specific DNA-methyltransferase [Bacillus pumilus]MDR4269097.1 site-specific DNA-methyltransferase [Bacillus pumilus]
MIGELELNRIYQRDCIEGMRMLPDKSIDMILCDLPYGTTRNKWDIVIPLDSLWEQYERVVKDNGAIVLTAAQPFTSLLVSSNPKLFRYDITWDKKQITGFLNAKRMPLRKHEDILIFYKKPPTYNPQFTFGDSYEVRRKHSTSNYGSQNENETKSDGRRYPTSIIEIPQIREKGGHPTQKPVKLFEWLIKTFTNEGDIILDSCIGSGTTAVAATQLNRNFIGFEIETEYAKRANQRLDSSVRGSSIKEAPHDK